MTSVVEAIAELQDEIRSLRKELAGERQRNTQRMMVGTVKSVNGSRVVAELTPDGEDGPVETPELRMAARTGKRGGGVSEFSKFGVGDPVLIISPSGQLGATSAVLPWTDSEDDPSPGTAEQDGVIKEIGNARFAIKNGLISIAVDGMTATFTDAGMVTNRTLNVTEGDIINQNKSVGATHKHTDVQPGGAQTGNPV